MLGRGVECADRLAITQARKRLGRNVFAELFERCCGPVAGQPGPTACGG